MQNKQYERSALVKGDKKKTRINKQTTQLLMFMRLTIF